MKTSPDIAKILTDITTFENKIPTGAPTSQLIAYHAYEDMFDEINDLAIQYNCKFSLYVDDMTFSSNTPFYSKKFIFEIEKILHKYNHRLNSKKIRYYSKNKPKKITGIILTKDNKLAVLNNLQKKVIDNFIVLKSKFENDTISKSDIKLINKLKG